MKFYIIASTSSFLALAVAGCATSEQDRRAGTGALIGAGAGALVGQAIGGNTGSTVAGAAGGAILGAVVGSATTPRPANENYCRYRRADGTIYTASC